MSSPARIGHGSSVFHIYSYEATLNAGSGLAEAAGVVGPWQRVKTPCAEIGTGVPATERGPTSDRVGVPTSAGWVLASDNPLPTGTNAVRFAVGELVVGDEYLAEISLRVLGAPLDPTMGADVNCSEVFGGDASSRAPDASDGGKDNTWRYFLPAPACVSLDLLFDLDVDKLQALDGDTITYTIRAKNLDAVNTYSNVVITDNLLAGVGNVTFVSATGGGVEAGGVVTWPALTLAPGDEVTFAVTVTGTGNASPILNRATLVSDQLAAPGFSVVALTNLGGLAVIELAMDAAPRAVAAGDTVSYTATVTNTGTGEASFGCADCSIKVTLPADFSVVPGSVRVDGNAAADPGGVAPAYEFTGGLPSIPAGGSVTLTFDALVDVATAPGLYRSGLETWLDDVNGREIDDAVADLAPVLVDVVQSDVPGVNSPIYEDSTTVCGTSSEVDGAVVTVYVDLLPAGAATVSSGAWCATVAPVFAGQNVSATVTDVAGGEIESDASAPVSVSGTGGVVPACDDGLDNDGDGLIDLNDPGCVDSSDLDETDVPQCSNGADDDGDGATDFPADTSCSSYADNDESGAPACSDNVDNDNDGETDFPADDGCDSAEDVSEADIPACANGIDDDNDGAIDYPADRGCASAADDDETGGGPQFPADAGPVDVDAGAGRDAGTAPDAARPLDPGGVGEPGGGCCQSSERPDAAMLLLLLLPLWFRRRRFAPR